MNESSRVVVYSKANCPACDKVKRELALKAVDFDEVRVDLDASGKLREFLISNGHRSVPVVYVDGVHTDPDTLTNEIIDYD